MKRLRFMVRPHRRSPEGKPVVSFGLRVGYWPCLEAPFLSLEIGAVSLDLWFGLPSLR